LYDEVGTAAQVSVTSSPEYLESYAAVLRRLAESPRLAQLPESVVQQVCAVEMNSGAIELSYEEIVRSMKEIPELVPDEDVRAELRTAVRAREDDEPILAD
jgi:hypothetical protein